MGTLIKISSPQNQLRQNKTLLLLTGGVATITGLFLWSATPFLASNPKDKPSVIFRYISLITSLGCGVTAVATGGALQRITPLLKAIETAERNDFLDQLANSQYVQQQRWQQEAMTALQQPMTEPLQSGMTPGNGQSGNGGTIAIVSSSADGTKTGTNTEPTAMAQGMTPAMTPITDEGMTAYKPMYLSVMALQQQGITESRIIKEVLQCEGRKYEQGKQMLEALLSLGQSQGW
jgi:hypothetical protein